MVKSYKLGTVEQFPEGKITPAYTEIEPIAVANVGGTLYAYRDSCTHDDSAMGRCHLVGEEIECPRDCGMF